jgi:murein DD-endopeptidase MepM/ murein hydrolase activator NlpD
MRSSVERVFFARSQTGKVGKPDVKGDGEFTWPVPGVISQAYSATHRAVDIAGPQGGVVVSADSGVVAYARWESSGYGNLVIVDHRNGYTSYYGHLYGFYVTEGQTVKRGQPVGKMGSTGRSTGPHVHFEIRYRGVMRDPEDLLPRD